MSDRHPMPCPWCTRMHLNKRRQGNMKLEMECSGYCWILMGVLTSDLKNYADGIFCGWSVLIRNPPFLPKLIETEWRIYPPVNRSIICPENGLSPDRRQAIIWTDDGIFLTGPLGTMFREIMNKIHAFSFKIMYLKMSSGKWQPSCLSLNMLNRPWKLWL